VSARRARRPVSRHAALVTTSPSAAPAESRVTVVVNRMATEWHLGMNPWAVGVILVVAATVSAAAATLLGMVAEIAPVWATALVLLASHRFGPKGVVPTAAACAVLGGWLTGDGVTLHTLQLVGIMATGYVAVGLASAATFYRLFRRLNAEHELRLSDVESERNRAVQIAMEREHLQQQLSYNATHDALTGLANRTLLLASIEEALDARRADGGRAAVLFLDLDDFKAVNDTLGHGAGDHLLEVVGDRLRNGIRFSDLVARLGGDEFAVLFPEFDPAAADAVVNRVLDTLNNPIRLGSRMVHVRASAGLVVSDGHDTALGVLGKADLAMYSVKERGKSDLAVFAQEMQSTRQERAELERDLAAAVTNGQLQLVYQPLVDLHGGRIIGCEALSRWAHPEHGPVPPDVFIPLAEATGAIVGIGEWVLEQACRRLSAWQRRLGGDAPFTMAVNVSARQLADDDVVARFADVLRRTAVDPRWVNLEITESLLLDDDELALDVLWKLRALGVRLAVDDFGTGYSSLSRLNRLPIQKLKIDKSFTLGLTADAEGRANATLISSAVAMAHGLGLQVVAEGVETQEHVGLLRHVGCDIGQGYLFSRPVAADDLDIAAAPFALAPADGGLLRTSESDGSTRIGLMPSAHGRPGGQPRSLTSRISDATAAPAPAAAPAAELDPVAPAAVAAAPNLTPLPQQRPAAESDEPVPFGRRRTDLRPAGLTGHADSA